MKDRVTGVGFLLVASTLLVAPDSVHAGSRPGDTGELAVKVAERILPELERLGLFPGRATPFTYTGSGAKTASGGPSITTA